MRLHANENPWPDEADVSPTALNRYFDGQPQALVDALAAHYGVDPASLLVTRGSDEAIDLLVRAFCRAGEDRILVCPPTFGMYRFSAEVQGAGVLAVPLADDFRLDDEALIRRWTPDVKVVFLCSPNNPTGNALAPDSVERVLAALAGRAIVAIDEAYLEFSGQPGFLGSLARHPGLVILRTLSKAHGLAGARCGVAIAAPALVELLGRIMPPYAMPGPTVAAALDALRPERLARTRRTDPRDRRRARAARYRAREPCPSSRASSRARETSCWWSSPTPRGRSAPRPRVASCCATSRASLASPSACGSRSAAAGRTTACWLRWSGRERDRCLRCSSTATAPSSRSRPTSRWTRSRSSVSCPA